MSKFNPEKVVFVPKNRASNNIYCCLSILLLLILGSFVIYIGYLISVSDIIAGN